MTILIPGTYIGAATSSAWTETFEANVPPGFSAYGISDEIPGAHKFECYINGTLTNTWDDPANPNPYVPNKSNGYQESWNSVGDLLRVVVTTNPGYPESRYGVTFTNEGAGPEWVYKFPGTSPDWQRTYNTYWEVVNGGYSNSIAVREGYATDGMIYDRATAEENPFGWLDGIGRERGWRVCIPAQYHSFNAGTIPFQGQMGGAGFGAFAQTGDPEMRIYRVNYDPLYWNPNIPIEEQSNLYWSLDDGYTTQENLVFDHDVITLYDTRVPLPVSAWGDDPGNARGLGPRWDGGINYLAKGYFDQLWIGGVGAIAINGPNPLKGALKIYVGAGQGKYDNNGWDIITNSSPGGDWYGYPDYVNDRQFKMWNGVTWSYGTDIELNSPGNTRTDPYQPNPGVGPKPFYVETDSGFVVGAWMLPMGPESDPNNYNTPASILPDGSTVAPYTGLPSDGSAVPAPTNYDVTGGGPDIGGSGGTGGTGGGAGGTVTVGTDPSATGHAGNIYNPWSGYSITGSWQDHMSYSLGGIDYPLGYGTPIAAPASGTLHTSGGSGDYATGWVGSAGRRSILYLDTPMPRVNPNLEQKEGSGPMVAIVFQHQSAFGTNQKHYGKGEFCGMSGASANGQNYGGDVHLHVHGLNASGQRLDFLNYV